MNAVFLLNLFLLSFLLQSTLVQYFTVAGVQPDLVLLLACLVGLFFGRHRGLLLGGLAGLIQDALSGSLLGLNALCKALVGFTSGVLQQNIGVHHRFLQMAVVGVMTAFDGLLTVGLVSLFRDTGLPIRPWVSLLALQVAYNSLVAAPYFALLIRVARRYLPTSVYANMTAASVGARTWLQRGSFRLR